MVHNGVLLDTGPLIALLSERDEHHDRCVEAAKSLRGPFFTSWPVITEAAYLLRDRPIAVQKLLAWICTSKIHLLQLATDDAKEIAQILVRYADQSFDLADVSLMWLVEREKIETVFTIDYRHFSVYRTKRGDPLSLVPTSM